MDKLQIDIGSATICGEAAPICVIRVLSRDIDTALNNGKSSLTNNYRVCRMNLVQAVDPMSYILDTFVKITNVTGTPVVY